MRGENNMKQIKSYLDIAFLSTYPSRKGGIGSFTEDFITTMDYSGTVNTHVIEICNAEDFSLDDKVIASIRRDELSDYNVIATRLNSSKINLLVIEHDFGIFGGDQGEYILELVHNSNIPIVTILHTVPLEPSPIQRQIIQELDNSSEKLITMAHNSKEILQTIYGIDEGKIDVIYHGVLKKQFLSRDTLKLKLGFTKRHIISTIGIIGPEKGIEDGIAAITKLLSITSGSNENDQNHKEILYLILNQTQSGQNDVGSAYKAKLEELIEKHNLSRNVKIVSKCFTKDEIVKYLQLSDIYMTPYLDKEQAVSGALAYAVGYGKAIVSTPYLYAKEMLSESNGLLAEFNNPDSLANCIKQIIDDPFKKAKMERNTLKIGRTMYWDKIALQYTNLFLNIIHSSTEVEELKNV
jgi:glycosyltransferase involved in cell wall biosynthesis